MFELLIRPSLNDHLVLADLLAPSVHQQRPVSRVVLNAPDAVRNPRLAEVAADAGTPVLVDPLTILLQSEVDPQDAWVKCVPFGREAALSAAELENPFILDAIVAETVEFQVAQGATAIIPPYFYAERPEHPAFRATIQSIARTARRLRADSIQLPVIPVLCAQLRGFVRRAGWQAALDQFAAAAADVGPQALALCLSPVGDGDESYAKVLDVLTVGRHLRTAGIPVLAWRQGVYGPSLVAAGIDGYECGMGIGERTNIADFVGARKPKTSPGTPFKAQGIYIGGLGRSLPPRVARLLFDDRKLQGRLVCDSLRCCPHGSDSMLSKGGRPHAVRARARQLSELYQIPNTAWRLHHIGKQAASAQVTAHKSNEILAAAGVPNRIKASGYEAIEQAADLLRSRDPFGARDSA